MNKQSDIPSPIVRLLHVIMLGFALLQIEGMFPGVAEDIENPASLRLSEFFINYQGGFVRRGLLGEGLYNFTTYTGIDCRWVIVPFCCLTFLLLASFLVLALARKKLCWWLLPLNFALFGVDFLRKDSCMLLIAALVLIAYTRIRGTYKRLIAVNALLMLGLNIHECVFFIIAVFMGGVILFDAELFSSRRRRCMALLPTLCMAACLSLFHGDENTAYAVYTSWSEIYPESLSDFSAPSAIQSLTWSTFIAVRNHLIWNFRTCDGWVYGYWEKPLLWLVSFFLTARLPFILQKKEGQAEHGGVHAYLAVLVFQWCAMFPLFTALHADASRALAYWSVSSLLIYSILPEKKIEQLLPRWYKKIISLLQRKIYSTKSFYVAPVLMCVAASSFCHVSVGYMFSHSVVGSYYFLIRNIAQAVSLHVF